MPLIAELAEVFDMLGVAVIVGGTLITAGRALNMGRIAGGKAAFLEPHRTFGKGLLLRLVMAVRTIPGFSIQIGTEGDLPWRTGRPGHQRRTNRPPLQPISSS